MKPNHTPTPWALNFDDQGAPYIHQLGETDDDTGDITWVNGDQGKDVANAEFIVRAVNCHEELLKFAKFVAEGLEDEMDRPPDDDGNDDIIVEFRISKEDALQILQTIAKAEGK